MRLHILFFLLLLIFSSCSNLQRSPNSIEDDSCVHTEKAFHCVKVVEVYDGDSLFIDLPDQHPLFGKRMGVRVQGIDTPEIKTKDLCEKEQGFKVKRIVEELISGSTRVDIIDVSKDKYFRILGDVIVDGKSLSEYLLEKKLAFVYHGEKKPERDWCEGLNP